MGQNKDSQSEIKTPHVYCSIFMEAKRWHQPKCPPVGEKCRQLGAHTQRGTSQTQKGGIKLFVATWRTWCYK